MPLLPSLMCVCELGGHDGRICSPLSQGFRRSVLLLLTLPLAPPPLGVAMPSVYLKTCPPPLSC